MANTYYGRRTRSAIVPQRMSRGQAGASRTANSIRSKALRNSAGGTPIGGPATPGISGVAPPGASRFIGPATPGMTSVPSSPSTPSSGLPPWLRPGEDGVARYETQAEKDARLSTPMSRGQNIGQMADADPNLARQLQFQKQISDIQFAHQYPGQFNLDGTMNRGPAQVSGYQMSIPPGGFQVPGLKIAEFGQPDPATAQRSPQVAPPAPPGVAQKPRPDGQVPPGYTPVREFSPPSVAQKPRPDGQVPPGYTPVRDFSVQTPPAVAPTGVQPPPGPLDYSPIRPARMDPRFVSPPTPAPPVEGPGYERNPGEDVPGTSPRVTEFSVNRHVPNADVGLAPQPPSVPTYQPPGVTPTTVPQNAEGIVGSAMQGWFGEQGRSQITPAMSQELNRQKTDPQFTYPSFNPNGGPGPAIDLDRRLPAGGLQVPRPYENEQIPPSVIPPATAEPSSRTTAAPGGVNAPIPTIATAPGAGLPQGGFSPASQFNMLPIASGGIGDRTPAGDPRAINTPQATGYTPGAGQGQVSLLGSGAMNTAPAFGQQQQQQQAAAAQQQAYEQQVNAADPTLAARQNVLNRIQQRADNIQPGGRTQPLDSLWAAPGGRQYPTLTPEETQAMNDRNLAAQGESPMIKNYRAMAAQPGGSYAGNRIQSRSGQSTITIDPETGRATLTGNSRAGQTDDERAGNRADDVARQALNRRIMENRLAARGTGVNPAEVVVPTGESQGGVPQYETIANEPAPMGSGPRQTGDILRQLRGQRGLSGAITEAKRKQSLARNKGTNRRGTGNSIIDGATSGPVRQNSAVTPTTKESITAKRNQDAVAEFDLANKEDNLELARQKREAYVRTKQQPGEKPYTEPPLPTTGRYEDVQGNIDYLNSKQRQNVVQRVAKILEQPRTKDDLPNLRKEFKDLSKEEMAHVESMFLGSISKEDAQLLQMPDVQRSPQSLSDRKAGKPAYKAPSVTEGGSPTYLLPDGSFLHGAQ